MFEYMRTNCVDTRHTQNFYSKSSLALAALSLSFLDVLDLFLVALLLPLHLSARIYFNGLYRLHLFFFSGIFASLFLSPFISASPSASLSRLLSVCMRIHVHTHTFICVYFGCSQVWTCSKCECPFIHSHAIS